jgi:hypothetical protein
MCHRFVIQHFTLINHNNQPNFVKGITYIEQIKNQNQKRGMLGAINNKKEVAKASYL